MAWYDSAVFYHIHSLSLCGCEHESIESDGYQFHKLTKWAEHAKKMGCNAIYIGPVFKAEMQGHGITDYYRIDKRLGKNEDFKQWVAKCHELGIKVVVDAVFNHVGRSFFAFQHLRNNGKKSAYREWFSNVNFSGDNEYGDGFQYEKWGGYMRLVKLNILSPWLHDYHFDTVRYWIHEFDIDGIRINAIDEMDYDFIKELRKTAVSMKPGFWMAGELPDREYGRWVNDKMLHSAPNNELQSAFISAHNNGNYPLIAHLLRGVEELCPYTKLYIFADNHDVSHIYEKLNHMEHRKLIALLMYTVYGTPSLYCGSEFSRQYQDKDSEEVQKNSLELWNYKNAYTQDEITYLHCLLGRARHQFPELSFGSYQQLLVTQKQFAFGRVLRKTAVITILNMDDEPAHLEIPLPFPVKKTLDVLEASISWDQGPGKGLEFHESTEFKTAKEKLVMNLPGNGGALIWVMA